MGFSAFFYSFVIGFTVPVVALKLTFIVPTVVHQLDALLGVDCRFKTEFANAQWVVLKKLDFVAGSNLVFELRLDVDFDFF